MMNTKKVLVIGLGNILLQDDGIGVRVVEHLRTQIFPPDIEIQFIDAGLTPDLTVFLEKGISKLIIIDAAETGGNPGDVLTINPLDVQNEASSIHGMDLQQNLELMRMAGTLPESVVIVGVEPADMSPGMELTEKLRTALPGILERVRLLIVN
jgi:hydrogenase maturation protease